MLITGSMLIGFISKHSGKDRLMIPKEREIVLTIIKIIFIKNSLSTKSPWRNRLARLTVNQKVGGSSPPGDDFFVSTYLNSADMLDPQPLADDLPKS